MNLQSDPSNLAEVAVKQHQPASASKDASFDILKSDDAFISKLDKFSIEDVVELKISRFLDQIGAFYPEHVYELIMNKVEKPLLSQILKRVGGNQVHAAKILGINRNTLRKKMKIYGLTS